MRLAEKEAAAAMTTALVNKANESSVVMRLGESAHWA